MKAPHIVELAQVDSTNAEARRRAESGDEGPVWITAARQTDGRGRRGRTWFTAEGNLAATLLTVTDMPPAQAAQTSFVAALAVCDLARAHLDPARVRLKWPNDVLVDGAKLAGILVESGKRDDGRLWLAVGVGVNLAHAPGDTDHPAAAVVAPGATPPDRLQSLVYLADRFQVWSDIWRNHGFEAIGEAWTERAYGLGAPCVARLAQEDVHGVAEGLDRDGALRLRLADTSIRRITAGDVFFEAA